METKNRIPILIAVILTAIIAGPSSYAPSCYGGLVIIQFNAEVTSVSDYWGILQGEITVGDTIAGTYTYDTSAPNLNPPGNLARYEYHAPPSGVSVHISGFESGSDPDNTNFFVEIEDDAHLVAGTRDTFSLVSENNLPFGSDVFVDDISLDFEDYSGHALSSVALPTHAPAVVDWSLAQVYISGNDLQNNRLFFSITGDLTSAVLIPEPATVLLLGMGCMVLLRRHRHHGNA